MNNGEKRGCPQGKCRMIRCGDPLRKKLTEEENKSYEVLRVPINLDKLLTSLSKCRVLQGVSVSARCLSSVLCLSSRSLLCSVAFSMSFSRKDAVTFFHRRLKHREICLVVRNHRTLGLWILAPQHYKRKSLHCSDLDSVGPCFSIGLTLFLVTGNLVTSTSFVSPLV